MSYSEATTEYIASGQMPELIFSYTRREAIEDGEQVDVTEFAAEFGFKYPVYITRLAYFGTVEVGGEYKTGEDGARVLALPGCQDFKGRLADVLTMLRFAIAAGGTGRMVEFSVSVDVDGDGENRQIMELFAGSVQRRISTTRNRRSRS